MPEQRVLNILLDQNVPYAVAVWLRGQRSSWTIRHVSDLAFEGRSDDFLFHWAQQEKAIVITFDEDFADPRLHPLGRHYGVVRLRVWPTTIEKTTEALDRLLCQLPADEWVSSLIIIDNQKIRIRKL